MNLTQGPAHSLTTFFHFSVFRATIAPSVFSSVFEMMAGANSSSLTLSFMSNGRRVKTFASPSQSGYARFQQFGLPPRIFAFPPSQSRGFVSFSCLNDQFEEIEDDKGPEFQVQSSTWNWRDYKIRYQYAGNSGSALVLIHGFGANSDHWKKNISILARWHKVYSPDLIGYGYSDKPDPDLVGKNFYTFETWAAQINDFVADVVEDDAFFICNSIGGVVGLQAAVMEPQICKGIVLLNISLRMLHIKKQPWYGRPLISSFQNLLRNTAMGKYFFRTVATPESVKRILCQCYHDSSKVTDELVQMILRPGLEPGAAGVFLEFICYSGGPLPEELLPLVKCPVLIAWGDKDPWEPIELGASFRNFDSVEDFVVLPNVGHCPQDEAPHLVNPLVESFVSRHTAPSPTVSSPI